MGQSILSLGGNLSNIFTSGVEGQLEASFKLANLKAKGKRVKIPAPLHRLEG